MKKGFTLIELLIVIAILAILATAVVLVLNPAELLRQGRDSTRISDLAALNSAIALFTADVITYTVTSTTGICTGASIMPKSVNSTTTCASSNSSSTAVNGAGWVPVNFNLISGGSPLPKLPIDPNNAGTTCLGSVAICQYVYLASSTPSWTYKILANMESTKYGTLGGSDVESNTKDGGVIDTWYEVGSNLALIGL